MLKDLDYFFLIQIPLRPSLCHAEVLQCLPSKGFPEDGVRGPSCRHHCLGWGCQPRTCPPVPAALTRLPSVPASCQVTRSGVAQVIGDVPGHTWPWSLQGPLRPQHRALHWGERHWRAERPALWAVWAHQAL